MKNKRLKYIVLAIVLILLAPIVAMQLTDEVQWTLMDFVVAGVLLLVTGLLLNFALEKVKHPKYRIGVAVAIIAGLLLIWAELAVGIFGSPLAGS